MFSAGTSILKAKCTSKLHVTLVMWATTTMVNSLVEAVKVSDHDVRGFEMSSSGLRTERLLVKGSVVCWGCNSLILADTADYSPICDLSAWVNLQTVNTQLQSAILQRVSVQFMYIAHFA